MKYTLLLIFFLSTINILSQEKQWIKTEAEITKISYSKRKTTRETAIVTFKLEDGTEQMGITELFHIPLIGSMKSVGDKITISYDKNSPAIVKTNSGKFLSDYGMYILILLGILFSIKRFLSVIKQNKK